jgi:hypothetical protein
VVLHLEKKSFALTRADVFQGLSKESAKTLAELGSDGWELVAAMPFSSGSAGLTSYGGTDAALGLFKRQKAA